MTLAQKPGAAACIGFDPPCTTGIAVGDIHAAEVSPDGRNVYTAASFTSALSVFDRAADGTLKQKPGRAGCIAGPRSFMDPAFCTAAAGFTLPFDVAVSPDGRNLYVAGLISGSVAIFDRAADGTLTQKPGSSGCISDTGEAPCTDGLGLKNAREVAVSSDGRNVYVAAEASIAVFDRAADGALTQKAGLAACVSETGNGPCTDGRGLSNPHSLALSQDGANLYATSSEGVAVFDRGSRGTLTQKAGLAACISDTASAGVCTAGKALSGATGVAVSPDGLNVYVSARTGSAVAVLDRAADGTLAQKPTSAGCTSSLDTDGACAPGRGLAEAQSVSVSPDNASVYVASHTTLNLGGLLLDGAGAIAIFDRSASGKLSQPAGTAACVSDDGSGGACIDGTGIRDPNAIALSPDCASAYIGGASGIGVFDRVIARRPPLPPPSARDATRPLLRRLALTPARFEASTCGASVVARGGSRVTFRVSEPAAVRFTVQLAVSGRRSGSRCVAVSRSDRSSKRCDRYRSLAGAFTYTGTAGSNALRFSGRLGNRRLAVGRYRLRGAARDAAGNPSRAALARFEIRRR